MTNLSTDDLIKLINENAGLTHLAGQRSGIETACNVLIELIKRYREDMIKSIDDIIKEQGDGKDG